MNILKNKFFLPAIAVGLVTGYSMAEWVVPKYFHPTPDTQAKVFDIFEALGAQPNYFRPTKSGNYLVGKFAQDQKDWKKANEYIGRVLTTDDDNIDLKKHAMVVAMASGDIKESLRIAKDVKVTEPDNILATLFLAMNDFKSEKYTQALETLKSAPEENAAAFLIPILKLWADVGITSQINIGELENSSFYAYHVLLMADFLKTQEAGLAYAKRGFTLSDIDVRDVEKIADLFSKFGERETALTLYRLISDKGFGDDDLHQKIDLLSIKKPTDAFANIKEVGSARDGAAIVFLDMANILFREGSEDSATIFAQMSFNLNPQLDENLMIIAAVSSRNEQYDQAIENYSDIKKSSEFYVEAQQQIADIYAVQEKNVEAIEILQKLYNDKGEINALIQIGDIYRYDENYKDAVQIYSTVIDKWEETPDKYWHVLYARGMAYERLGDFKKSEADLLAALKFRPEHPYLLNYLGYSWADQDINLDQALDMITRALQMKPNDGYIADSLGWVYYKMGQYEDAVPFLERAVELMPYDATLNDHLGDAYWKVDRQKEAKFQWQRAANYSEDNEAELKEGAQQKLKYGLVDNGKPKAAEDKKEAALDDSDA